MSPFQFFNDIKRKTAYLVYDIVPSKEQTIQNFYDAFLELNNSEKLWIITGTEIHGDAKRTQAQTPVFPVKLLQYTIGR
jgi:oligoribonuclease NrnB/cAMP/cGMP phosphodiesterase (DHH superfamily)